VAGKTEEGSSSSKGKMTGVFLKTVEMSKHQDGFWVTR